MAGAIDAVGVGPSLHRFFAIGPDQPDAVSIALFARGPRQARFWLVGAVAKLVGVFEQDGGGGAAVVGTHVSDIAQRVVRVVVPHDDDDAIFFAGKFGDDVADGELPFHGVGDEGVVFHLIAFQIGR